jgi:16S rRNA (cytosine967-C5)-methyltransferase
LTRRWRRRFGPEETSRLLAWNDSRPSLTLQAVRWTETELAGRLEAAGFQAVAAPFGAGIRVSAGDRVPRPTTLPGFDAGAFIVQDAAAALVCRFAALAGSGPVYDACAAPGGKAVLLARDGARVIAGEPQRRRLPRLIETVRRVGAPVAVVAADALAAPFGWRSCDAVLVDAPCTATGVIARHPDARWRLSQRAIARAAQRQSQLLDAAGDLVRPGGILVYATCSLEPEENADVVNAFLERHRNFQRVATPAAVAAELLTPAGDLTILPQRHGMDGAYAARLRRTA